jgi:transposase
LRKLKLKIQEALNINLSKELVRTVLSKAGYKRKVARHYGQPKDLNEKTSAFLHTREQFKQSGFQFLSLDETSFGRNNTKSYGYALRGQKLRIMKKQARTTTVSVMALYSENGLIAMTKSSKAFNSLSFLNFLKSIQFPLNSVILMDNVSFHHSSQVLSYLESQNVKVLFVPPYSPWFNPIEGIFSIVKRHFYDNEVIEDAFSYVTELHCLSFFQKSQNAVRPF